ncbi:hypothetical protein [Bacilliculturomica massiliensis]|uniref:hypothetical protein n=1 Tax=Bacilliculturomica massiliensis TaxID=1917867 RepID=UPI00102F5016|nr:hypothetical protein [Bacilliculturomica massiliensis]
MSNRSLNCPHCDTKLERNKTIYGGYGCPIKICTECGQTLIDPAIKEPALKTPFAFRVTVLLDMLRVMLAVWAMCLVFAYFILELFWNQGHGWLMVLCGTALTVVFLIVRGVRSPFRPEEIRRQIAESIERLDDTEYANFLASAGIYIYENSMYCLDRGKDRANVPEDGAESE